MTIFPKQKSLIDTLLGMEYFSVEKYLESNGFKQIGDGCESDVYSKDDIDWVLKIQHSPFTFSSSKVDPPSHEDFAEQVVFDNKEFNIIIQVKCEMVNWDYWDGEESYLEFSSRVEKQHRISDIHEDNVALLDGRLVVIDWTTRSWSNSEY